MLSVYLNQTCELRRCTGSDMRGQPVYSAPITVPCRRQERTQNTISANEQTVNHQTIYYLSEHLSAGDTLDGHIVSAVYPMTAFDGSFSGCKAVI